jgi:hypothetical protein
MHFRVAASLETCGHQNYGQKKRSFNLDNCMKSLRSLMVSVNTSVVMFLNTWFIIFTHWLFFQAGLFYDQAWSLLFQPSGRTPICVFMLFHIPFCILSLTWFLHLFFLGHLSGSLFHIFIFYALREFCCHLLMSYIYNFTIFHTAFYIALGFNLVGMDNPEPSVFLQSLT